MRKKERVYERENNKYRTMLKSEKELYLQNIQRIKRQRGGPQPPMPPPRPSKIIDQDNNEVEFDNNLGFSMMQDPKLSDFLSMTEGES